jgi:hypothetical protein
VKTYGKKWGQQVKGVRKGRTGGAMQHLKACQSGTVLSGGVRGCSQWLASPRTQIGIWVVGMGYGQQCGDQGGNQCIYQSGNCELTSHVRKDWRAVLWGSPRVRWCSLGLEPPEQVPAGSPGCQNMCAWAVYPRGVLEGRRGGQLWAEVLDQDAQ